MNVRKIEVGYLHTNCYILEQKGNCLVIDPGDDLESIKAQIGKNKLLAVLVTHHHEDHVGALDALIKEYSVPVYDFWTTKEQKYEIGPFNFEVIHTPGHTSDSITFYFYLYQLMFVGDFIFQGTIGRTDLETGNPNTMKESIEKIKKYPEVVKCYSGHGENTSLKEEKENNYFFTHNRL